MRRLALALATVLFLVGALFFACAGPRTDSPANLRLSLDDLVDASGDSSSSHDPRIRFAVAAVLSPRQTLDSYEAFRLYLEKHLGKRVEFIQNRTYAETNALVRSGDVTLALVCSGAYVAGRREFGMEALAVPVVNGERTYRSLLIVPAGSTAQTWEDLRHKTFAYTDPLSNTGRLVPAYVISQKGEAAESYFKDFIFTYAHDRSIRAVADGLVDGAAVDSLVYEWMARDSPFLTAKTRVIWESSPFGINPFVVNPNIDPAVRRELLSLLLGMNNDEEGRSVLAQLGIDGFSLPDPGAYEGIVTMMAVTKGAP